MCRSASLCGLLVIWLGRVCVRGEIPSQGGEGFLHDGRGPLPPRLSRVLCVMENEISRERGTSGLHHNTHFVSPDDTGYPRGTAGLYLLCPLQRKCTLERHQHGRCTWAHMAKAMYVGGHTYTQKEKKKGTSMREPPLKPSRVSSLSTHMNSWVLAPNGTSNQSHHTAHDQVRERQR